MGVKELPWNVVYDAGNIEKLVFQMLTILSKLIL